MTQAVLPSGNELWRAMRRVVLSYGVWLNKEEENMTNEETQEEPAGRTHEVPFGCPGCGSRVQMHIFHEPLPDGTVADLQCGVCGYHTATDDLDLVSGIIDGLARLVDVSGFPMERRMMMTQSSVEVSFDAVKSKAVKQVNVKVYNDDPQVASDLASGVLAHTLKGLEERGVYVPPTARD